MQDIKKNHPKRTLLATTLALFAFGATAFGHIEVDAPDGGEFYCAGNVVTIQWHILIAHSQNNWDLEYSTTGVGGPWIPIVTDLAPGSTAAGSSHTYAWTVPDVDSSQMRVRVTMDNSGTDYNDTSNADFDVAGVGSATAVFRNDSGNLNPVGFVAAAPVLGSSWVSSVDNTGTVNTLAGVVGFATSLELPLSFGVLLTNIADPGGELLNLPVLAGTGVVPFSLSVPNDAAICGATLSAQGFGFGGGAVTLHNAFDLVLGA